MLNNPLAYTDPSGYFSLKKLFRAVVTIVVTIYAGPGAGAAVNAAFTYHDTGSFSAALKSAAITYATAQGFAWAGAQGGVGEVGANSVARYAAHALVGCLSAAASGGQCGAGAASAVFGKFATNQITGMGGDNLQGVIVRGVATAVAGGAGSVIAGGKFDNGAMTAAFGYLFNHVSGTFSKKTGVLTLTDTDTGETVSAQFKSGGDYGAEAAPNGEYDILSRGGRSGFYRLEARDPYYGDDKVEFFGQNKMTEIRLHHPGVSLGCITACDASGWAKVDSLLNRTTTSSTEVQAKSFLNRHLDIGRLERVKSYGKLKVID